MIDLKSWMTNVTKALICEMGANYIRFDNGLQICWINTTVNMAINSAYGSMYIGSYVWTFPKEFISTPAVAIGECHWGTSASWGAGVGGGAASYTIRAFDLYSRASGPTTIRAIAIGYWK